MSISSFDDLIRVARQQPEPQRLLFVFTRVELPDDCTPEQRARFEAGKGGALTPLMCLDKTLEELGTFSDLLEESQRVLQDWTIVFVAALSGNNGCVPRSEDAEAPLNRMVESIKAGSIGSFIPFDAHGQPVLFGPS
ncbi:ribonucleotide reductase subunit alpha [Paraburkholderia sp. NMBU_R16]|uniref:ribonucleotide reductase subunit alpha n=1 Tax=Paraburkholderia sp. NMBU_R16 TaxID=2698676 RepID=UPI001564D4DB|nr:ribonucleotide reductase subunit alpha [Paraburkholderia sp. NMBU_R16]NRO97021.1 ribonucleotide reductase subunit alpha [Paraburkholderia sp. NMBU_R16]